MFNYHMSYAELSTALNTIAGESRLLTEHEIKCISKSLESPFLKAMLQKYPLRVSAQALVEATLRQMDEHTAQANPNEQNVVHHQRVTTSVHDALFASGRLRTSRYLQKHFPATKNHGLMERLEDFVNESLANLEVVNCTPLKGACFPSSNINKLILLDFLF
ncbi:MAG: hypothetical protein FJ161_05225 [Gammaproteobacteria bacterium]|nr:hypothetical protein [Gammaproteobacteria bacterium]